MYIQMIMQKTDKVKKGEKQQQQHHHSNMVERRVQT
jgi:GTP-binding protein EngB required for normal cell division